MRQTGRSALLLEFNLSGKSLDSSSIFDVVSKRTNLAVNVRLFKELDSAKTWLTEGPGNGK